MAECIYLYQKTIIGTDAGGILMNSLSAEEQKGGKWMDFRGYTSRIYLGEGQKAERMCGERRWGGRQERVGV